MEFAIIFLLIWFAFGFFGWRILVGKGRSGLGGLLLGLCLGIIGLFIALLMSPSREHKIAEARDIQRSLGDDR